jgi:site-specific DNA recombinase
MLTPESIKPAALRFAWWGRVSTDDQQDPTLSLPRQLHNSRAALPPDATIVAHFYDVESGRKELSLRGRGSAHEHFAIPIPRDGGIHDLLHEAAAPSRRFDAVVCESIERIARRTYFGTKIEHDLEQSGVLLCAADEPIVLNGKRATTILTRRVKQSVAEWYVLEILEKSWDGTCEHTRQGWNIGRPPYGYIAQRVPHPVPSKRAAGAFKTRLVPDELRAAVVYQVFNWRTAEGLGYVAIQDRLNSDLSRYPPPTATAPSRTRDLWSRSSARDILGNPKYTGYMVWNRRSRARGGKLNPKEDWVWSQQPTHEPIVTLDMFQAANSLAIRSKGSRSRAGANLKHPDTKRTYALRSFVRCSSCGNRMQGKYCRGHVYYVCEPARNLGQKFQGYLPDHPPSIWVREDSLSEVIFEFFSVRVFGPRRLELLSEQLNAARAEAQAAHETQTQALKAAIAKLDL